MEQSPISAAASGAQAKHSVEQGPCCDGQTLLWPGPSATRRGIG